jgi:hypothetical protein
MDRSGLAHSPALTHCKADRYDGSDMLRIKFSLRALMVVVSIVAMAAGSVRWVHSSRKWVRDRQDAVDCDRDYYREHHCFTVGLSFDAAPPWPVRLFGGYGVRLVDPRFEKIASEDDIQYVANDLVRLFPEATVRVVGDSGKVTDYGLPAEYPVPPQSSWR